MLVRRVVLMLAAALLPAFAQAPGKGLVIVLIGPPGGGKTTQAAFLQKRYRIAVLAGDEL
ncbi:MAG: hypothetical protein IT161_23580, partial [Bryobacterales bacterium]|nr:hypothetical protein [Bryobacterales bacterium]